MSLHCSEDLILAYESATDASAGRHAKCRVRLYDEAERRRGHYEDANAGTDADNGPLVLLSELADNPGEPVVRAADVVAGNLIGRVLADVLGPAMASGADPAFVCHYPPLPRQEAGGRYCRMDLYEIVVFESLEVGEYLVEEPPAGPSHPPRTVLSVGAATFKPLAKEMIEPLIGSTDGSSFRLPF